MRSLFALVVLAVFLPAALLTMAGEPAYADQQEQGPDAASRPGINERLGETLPLDIFLTDDSGNKVLLQDLITKPTILNFVYYRCSHTCPALLTGLSEVLSKLEIAPGRDFSVLTISFDETDTPDLAAQKKIDYHKAAGREFPEGSWPFLTADKETIMKITRAAGFGFRRAPNGFAHPVALIVVSPKGKITRYLYGIRFLPMDLTMAITEASKGLAVPTVNKLLLYCYSYDPEGRRYVFDILKITAAATIFFIILFIGWLTLWGKKKERGTGGE
ncbi:MAG: SCO family protein [Thermodesulfovibrio sp.]|nr:SCO family protein [Thermodesulfovibrio sp.]